MLNQSDPAAMSIMAILITPGTSVMCRVVVFAEAGARNTYHSNRNTYTTVRKETRNVPTVMIHRQKGPPSDQLSTAARIVSCDWNPEKNGMPDRAAPQMIKMMKVTGKDFCKPPRLRMSCTSHDSCDPC